MNRRVVCQTPTPNKEPVRIDLWKYEAIRQAILAIIPADDFGLTFAELPKQVQARLDANDLAKLGSVNWYTTVVKLDMEVRGELERVPNSSPQRLRLPDR